MKNVNVLVLSLKLTGLVPSVVLEGAVQGQLEAGQLLLVVHGGEDGVVTVSVPLLSPAFTEPSLPVKVIVTLRAAGMM